MITWRRGQAIVTRNRVAQEGPLNEFLDGLAANEPPLVRVPGVAVFLCRDKDTTPLALRADVEHTHSLHREGRDRLGRHRQHPPRRHLRQDHGAHTRPRPVQGLPRDRPGRLPRQAQRPRRARAGAQARAAWTATSTSSTPPTSSRGSRSPPPTLPECDAGASSSSSPWPATRRARSATSDYRENAPS